MVESEQPTTEGELLEMSKHFKELLEERETEINNLKGEIYEIKKVLISVYGVIRIVDELLGFTIEAPHDITALIETVRGYLSEYMDKYIFKILD